jgi:hypothetical protein
MQHHAIPCKEPKGYTLPNLSRRDPMAILPGTRLGPYEITSAMGAGIGVVWQIAGHTSR